MIDQFQHLRMSARDTIEFCGVYLNKNSNEEIADKIDRIETKLSSVVSEQAKTCQELSFVSKSV
jgi:hypothetical protein